PPPVPQNNESLSVRIAVNGKDYGPYERVTLLEMISNGALTPQTMVFMEGMTEWLPASHVPAVSALFKNKKEAPKTPPIPWAPSPTAPPKVSKTNVSEDKYQNGLSLKLNRLITAAVADGEISDLERQVLIRNAQEENVPMDEFVMILEARLFEQRQVLFAQQKEMEHRQQMEKAAQAVQVASMKVETATHKAKQDGNVVKKCPACGAPIKAIATCCPECGYDYSADNGTSPVERLNAQLSAIDNEKASGLMGKYLSVMGAGDQSPEKIEKKKRVIMNFPLPSDKMGILDLFIACASQAGGVFSKNKLGSAYKTKAEQILSKARIIMKDDPKLFAEINDLANKYKIKA
ncbi:MAG: DUF4339 domain-containing protein, partial [Bacteroidales bacterium]|nr:DUF4339 domain-containing protein [Bacteroidales bacterium]